MDIFNILTLTFSIIGLFLFFILYIKYGFKYKSFFKITTNEFNFKKFKKSFFLIISISLFYGVFFAATLTTNQSYSKINTDTLDYAIENNWSHGQAILSEYYLSEINVSEGVPSYNDKNNNGKYDDGEAKGDSSGSFWIGGEVIETDDLLDRTNWRLPDYVANVIHTYGNNEDDLLVSFENYNPFVSEIKENNYIYYLDYLLANSQKEYLDDPQKEFYYKMEYKFNYNLKFQVNNNNVTPFSTIQFVSVPEPNKQNTYNNTQVNQFLPKNSKYKHPEINQAYAIDMKHETYKLNSKDIVNIGPHDIEIIDVGYQQDYLRPSTSLLNDDLIKVTPSTISNSDSLILFVNEQTFFNILEFTYYDSKNDKWMENVFNTYIPSYVNTSNDKLENVVNVTAEILIPYFYSETFREENDIYGITDYYISDVMSEGKGNVDTHIKQNMYYIKSALINNSYYNSYYRGSNNDSFLISTNRSVSSNIDIYIYETGFSSVAFGEEINNSISATQVILFLIIIIGLAATLFLVNKLFRNNIKEIGILKASGYSQSSLSIIILNKIFLTLILGVVISLIFIPLFNLFWYFFILNAFSVSFSFFTLTFSNFVNFIFFPLILFTLVSFIYLRFRLVSKDTLDLISEVSIVDSNSFVLFLDKNETFENYNFGYLVKNGFRQIPKSLVLFISSFISSIFILFTFSITSIQDNTTNYIRESINFNDISILSNGENQFIRSISIEDFENGIDNGSITDYTFGSESINEDPDWFKEKEQSTWCENYNNYIVDYIENEPINNNYISPNTVLFVKNVIDNTPQKLDCDTFSPRRQKPKYYNSLEMFSNKYSDEYIYIYKESNNNVIRNDSNKGIAIGYLVEYDNANYSTFVSSNNKYIANVNDNTINSLDRISYSNESFLKNIYSSSFNDKDIIESYIDISSKKDGKVYFLENGVTELDSLIQENSNLSLDLKFPSSFYIDENESDDENNWIEVYYYDSIDIPWFSNLFININDPDLNYLFPQLIDLDTSEIHASDNVNNGVNIVTGNSNNSTNLLKSSSDTLYYSTSIFNNKNIDFKYKLRNNESLTLSDILNEESNEIFITNTNLASNVENVIDILYVLLENRLINNDSIDEETKNNLLNNLQDLEQAGINGFVLDISLLITSMSEGTIQNYQETLQPIAYMTLIFSILLILIIILIIISDNKWNNNLMKVIGYSPIKSTFLNFSFYSFIILIASLIAIPIMFVISFAIQSSIAPIEGIVPILVNPLNYQYWILLAIAISIFLLTFFIAYIINKNSKPALYGN